MFYLFASSLLPALAPFQQNYIMNCFHEILWNVEISENSYNAVKQQWPAYARGMFCPKLDQIFYDFHERERVLLELLNDTEFLGRANSIYENLNIVKAKWEQLKIWATTLGIFSVEFTMTDLDDTTIKLIARTLRFMKLLEFRHAYLTEIPLGFRHEYDPLPLLKKSHALLQMILNQDAGKIEKGDSEKKGAKQKKQDEPAASRERLDYFMKRYNKLFRQYLALRESWDRLFGNRFFEHVELPPITIQAADKLPALKTGCSVCHHKHLK